MKKHITLITCLFLYGTSFAQGNATTQNDPAKAQRQLVATGKCAINGTIMDDHKHPISDARLFIYGADSSILASGFSDANGAYETNSVLKGTYNVKVVYPNSKTLMIAAIALKPGFTPINIKAAVPTADTSIPFTEFVPKPAEKNKHGKGTKAVSAVTTTTTTTKVTTTTTTTKAATTATLAPAPKKN